MFITSKNKYLSNDMKIFGTCSIPLSCMVTIEIDIVYKLKRETIMKPHTSVTCHMINILF